MYRGGGWQTLPLVVQFDCPFDHVDGSGERWAKVLLKVNPGSGWVSLHEDSCHRCSVKRIEQWLRDLINEQRRESSRGGVAPGEGPGTRAEGLL